MDGFGLIHEQLDIKILILYILRRLPGTVDTDTLLDICSCDKGASYFDYYACLNELVDNGNIDKNEAGYQITKKGARNADTVESSIPYSVRMKAEAMLAPVAEKLRRDASIKTYHDPENGGVITHLIMSDGKGEVINLSLLCGDETQAKLIEKNFRLSAEKYYQQIVAFLSEEKEK